MDTLQADFIQSHLKLNLVIQPLCSQDRHRVGIVSVYVLVYVAHRLLIVFMEHCYDMEEQSWQNCKHGKCMKYNV